MKKAAKIILGATLLLFLFKGPLYRFLISYHDIGTRHPIELTNQNLTQYIDNETTERTLNIDEIIGLSSKLTASHLTFTSEKVSADPNDLASSKKANCVGYAAMFNTIATHITKTQGLQDEFEVQHKIGKLKFLGIDLHQFSSRPLFKDHDYNVILNKVTKMEVAVDASASDYLWVDRVKTVPQ